MRMRSLFCAVALSAATAGCGVIYQEPSSVAQGKYYSSGNPGFDEFFIKLHRLQVELASAPDGPRRVRATLAKHLGLNDDAADQQIEIRVHEEAQKLAGAGARLKLELPSLPPEQSPQEASVTVRSSKNPLGDGALFVSGVQSAATELLRIRNRMRVAQKELEKLRVQGVELDGQIDTAFRKESPWKRDEVRENITDGQKLITLMIARSEEVGDGAERLLEAVVRAATTDQNLGASKAVEPEPASGDGHDDDGDREAARKPKPGKGGKKNGAKPAKSRPPANRPPAKPAAAPAPAPAPKPPPAEAAPKEFEP